MAYCPLELPRLTRFNGGPVSMGSAVRKVVEYSQNFYALCSSVIAPHEGGHIGIALVVQFLVYAHRRRVVAIYGRLL